MFINIHIISRNQKSLNDFLEFLLKLPFFSELNLKSTFKHFYKKTNRKIVTVLKSPHVNKTSQEHFEYLIFSKKINIYSFQIFKILMVLKKIQRVIGFDVIIKVKFIISFIKKNKHMSYILHPKIHKLKYQKLTSNFSDTELQHYLKIFDVFGSFKSLNSSVGRAKD